MKSEKKHIWEVQKKCLLYLWMPWKVLLAMSTMPPVGRATTPTNPLPMPLKKPAAPSFFAPTQIDEERGDQFVSS